MPTFGRWTDQPLETGKRVNMFPLQEPDDYRLDLDAYLRFIRFRECRVAVVCNPNNPDGGFVSRREPLAFVDDLRGWKIKTYGITAAARPRTELVAAALRRATAGLPERPDLDGPAGPDIDAYLTDVLH